MKLYFRYIASFCLVAWGLMANAQDSLQVHTKDSTELIAERIEVNIGDTLILEQPDSTSIESPDTTATQTSKTRFSVLIGADYGKLVTTVVGLENKYEFNLGVQFANKLRLTADYGFGDLAPPNAIENGTYNSTGNYYRAGLDYIFTIGPKVYLSLGGMYASSSFKDEGTVLIESEIWPSLKESFVREDFTANWVEFVLTTEATIVNKNSGFFNNLYWGLKLRLRFLIERPQPVNFDVYAIPGYGRTWNDIVPAANLFIAYKF